MELLTRRRRRGNHGQQQAQNHETRENIGDHHKRLPSPPICVVQLRRRTFQRSFLLWYVADMRMDLAFGKTGVTVTLPEGYRYRVLEARSAQPLPDPLAAIESALDSPEGTPPLAELARGKASAAISICDITRPAPNRQVLPPLLARLEQAGIHREAITILIATGLHRPATQAEIREIAGESIASTYRIENHHAREISEHRALGSTASGTPVYVDERFVSADLHITLAFSAPHPTACSPSGRRTRVASATPHSPESLLLDQTETRAA